MTHPPETLAVGRALVFLTGLALLVAGALVGITPPHLSGRTLAGIALLAAGGLLLARMAYVAERAARAREAGEGRG